MRELLHTVLELEEWNKNSTCYFCFNKSVCQVRTRSKITHQIVANNMACENCKEKFENNELPKCERCGRFRNRHSFVCRCISNNEDVNKKELPALPSEEREATFYERQINNLREQLTTTEEELNIEREEVVKFQEKSEEWSKKQKQELLDRIKELEAEVERLTSQQTAQVEVKETKKFRFLPFGKKS